MTDPREYIGADGGRYRWRAFEDGELVREVRPLYAESWIECSIVNPADLAKDRAAQDAALAEAEDEWVELGTHRRITPDGTNCQIRCMNIGRNYHKGWTDAGARFGDGLCDAYRVGLAAKDKQVQEWRQAASDMCGSWCTYGDEQLGCKLSKDAACPLARKLEGGKS